MTNDEYISDLELEELMGMAERDMVKAPEYILENVLDEIEAQSSKRKITEFRRYCIRVITSAAAAIVFMMAIPNLSSPASYTLRDKKIFNKVQNSEMSLISMVGQSHLISDNLGRND